MAGEVARRLLAGTPFADLRWVAETGSTNTDLAAAARDGAPHGSVLVADHQTAGRGRRDRTWVAPPGAALLVSILLRLPPDTAPLASMAVAVAATEAIATTTAGQVAARLKWPNDLVWPGDGSRDDRKLAGILAEATWPAGPGTGEIPVVVGMGLNVEWATAPPPEIGDVAIALSQIIDRAPDREAILIALLKALEPLANDLREHDAVRLLETWRGRSATIGRRVRVDLGAEQFVGTAEGVDSEGRLIVRAGDGATRVVAAGDVVHLRSE